MASNFKTVRLKKKDETQFGRSTALSFPLSTAGRLRVLLFVLVCIFINLIFPPEKIYESFDIPKEGDITKKPIIAPFTFDILKTDEELQRERAEAMAKVLPVLEYDYDVTEKIFNRFTWFFDNMTLLNAHETPDSVKQRLWADLKKDVSVSTIKAFTRGKVNADNLLFIIDNMLDEGISAVLVVRDIKERDDFKARYNIDFVNYLQYKGDFVTLLRDEGERTVPAKSLLVKEGVIEREKAQLKKMFPPGVLEAVYELIYAYVSPNIFYSEELTSQRRVLAANSVLKTSGKVIKDLEIVGKNKLVTPDIYRKIYSLQIAQESMRKDTSFDKIMPIMGRVFLNTLIVGLFFLFASQRRKDCFTKPAHIASIVLVLALQYTLLVATLKIVDVFLVPLDWNEKVEFAYLLPMVLGPMLITVLFDFEMGGVFCLTMAFLAGVVLHFEFRMTLVHFFAGLVAAAGVRNIRYRSQFFLTLLLYSFAYFVLITAMSLIKFGQYDQMTLFKNFGLAGLSGAISIMLAITLIWIFEKTFGITTNLSLIELSDMNSPVLKRLSIEAPGTYHHSVLIGNLAESAAEAISANPLKTRVLAYYHDIGKIHKPEYFIENQGNNNLHDKISPRMSALIISSHVKQGIDLAKRYKLPAAIRDVIKEHHGTTLISFFYEKAKELDETSRIMREEFCYPGPKPQTKESALIMLADSVEAASRALSEPTTSRLRSLTDSIIESKIADGQLDNCDLTFSDLAKIKESFMPVLAGMFHTRIEYPETDMKKTERRVVRPPEERPLQGNL
ncbi:MAG: hypothetical protein A2487_16915 [Candidatus Raymondbacteria bacterium RifOxyC12_full_50_8]|uniref:HD/PDEase domain-containing protein n=1 Tax=Candidatus Raymondbacteria bacterium RIFOXYD12_FULL_49_13 TaxID=1817890 RepID=A0A1F7F091_UNCRA|nr:MAG: hypothetical protein A2248_21790 [Candidatus Raymondbacteria bacterium RIFOXYA2_FULL_49_16]OGK00070.1 MAG: hypothetical protein A2519_22345 [Candidatus Raymondbacteria bacterium RIFOXYD12_FULL_49_13]OGK01359.1 MAG: hypothetical protein A2487_16915 [Candidatus Raymondbacteria bacterium RifOxyC12_full_50_8]OGK03687.1 MAG: hypothetical protein A2350_13025 [Candidatus Raymondbacteria bacterium RifOxyB12_full_50_8]OGP45059.1 MAG: hypothetical protein A2324_13670 [Candidatus Raymondbacteria b